MGAPTKAQADRAWVVFVKGVDWDRVGADFLEWSPSLKKKGPKHQEMLLRVLQDRQFARTFDSNQTILKEAYSVAWRQQQKVGPCGALTFRVMERVCKEHQIRDRVLIGLQKAAMPNLSLRFQQWQRMTHYLHKHGPSPQRELCEHLRLSKHHLGQLREWGVAEGWEPVYAIPKVGIVLLEPLKGNYQELLWEEAVSTYCETYEIVRMTPLLVYMNVPTGARSRVREVLRELLSATHKLSGDKWVRKVRKKTVVIHEAQIVALLSEGGTWTKHQIAKRLDVSTSTAVNKLKRLVEEKRIMAIEAGKGFIYMAL